MQALTFHGVRDVRCERVPDPALVDPGDVLVRVDVAAICGSDLHPYRGNEVGIDDGTVMGHEFVGEIVDVGADVSGFGIGDRVVSPFSTNCGSCPTCDDGLTARCGHGELFGWVEGGRGLQGVQAELVRVPFADATIVGVPSGIPSEEALLAGDVLSTGYFCAHAARFAEGATVVVLGCGPVGLMAVVGARELGAARVIAVDSIRERLELAARFGATPVQLQTASEDVLEATDGRGADAVLEVVGSAAASRLAIDLVRAGGTISAVGVHTEAQFAFTPGEAYDRNLTYVTGRCSARHFAPRMLDVLAARKYPVADMFSHRMALEDGARGYEIFDGKLEGCTKVLLMPST